MELLEHLVARDLEARLLPEKPKAVVHSLIRSLQRLGSLVRPLVLWWIVSWKRIEWPVDCVLPDDWRRYLRWRWLLEMLD